MSCAEYSASIQLYIDNELTGHALEEFQAHLESCADCRKALEAAEEPLQWLRLTASVRVSGLISGFIFAILCYLLLVLLTAAAWESWRLLR
jgi:Putative zinc-finger